MGEQQVSHIFSKREYQDHEEVILNIYTHPVGGIGNRIKNIISRIRLYQGYFHTADIHWAIGGSVYSRFFDLFNPEFFFRINELNHSVFLDYQCREEDLWNLLLTADEYNSIRDQFEGVVVDLKYEKTPQLLKDLYIPYFQKLKPSEGVQRLIDTVQLPEKCVSVHIRHSNDWKMWQRWAEGDIELFIEEMQKYDPDTYFYLVCHIREIEDIMRNIFKDRIITLPGKDYEKKDNKPHIADMYNLSKTPKMIATYGSTFCECAWWLGECRQEVTVIGSGDRWGQDVASNRVR